MALSNSASNSFFFQGQLVNYFIFVPEPKVPASCDYSAVGVKDRTNAKKVRSLELKLMKNHCICFGKE